jgi:hypothetical protein
VLQEARASMRYVSKSLHQQDQTPFSPLDSSISSPRRNNSHTNTVYVHIFFRLTPSLCEISHSLDPLQYKPFSLHQNLLILGHRTFSLHQKRSVP